MGKKKRNENDDYWSSNFEADLNLVQGSTESLTLKDENPNPTEVVEQEDKGGPSKSKKNNKKKKNNEEKNQEKKEVKKGDKKDDLIPNVSTAGEESPIVSADVEMQEANDESKEMDDGEDNDEDAKKKKKKKKKKPAEKEAPAPKRPGNSALAAIRERLELQKKLEEEEKRLAEEEERKRLEEEKRIEEEQRKIEEEKKRKKEKQKAKKEELKKQGKLLSKSEKEKQAKNKAFLEQLGVNKDEASKVKKFSVYDMKKKKKVVQQQDTSKEDDVAEDWEDEMEEDWEDIGKEVQKKEQVEEKVVEEEDWETEIALEPEIVSLPPPEGFSGLNSSKRKQHTENLRSPICVILGHVDTGKTKLLDKIRQTNVQEGEAGGITQQIGATYFPSDAIIKKTRSINKGGYKFNVHVPGLLVIDTPGHESFTNLRSRGSSLCNIAILVVDIMHGLEPQTIESLGLLRQRKTPFIVALNKIDRIFGWEQVPDEPFVHALVRQKPSVRAEFEDRINKTMLLFAEQGLNALPYYKNTDFRTYVSLVPTSAITGEGIPDLLMLLVLLTQTMMSDKLLYLSSLECTVLEVKVVEGLGTTVDVVLSNGILKEGDRIVLCGLNGPIATNIRALLTPQPLRELRVKSNYVHHKMIKAAMGVKICAPDLEKAIAGSRLLVVGPNDDEEELKEDVMEDLTQLLQSIDKSGKGVCVQASTLGSLEALLQFLKDSKIPVNGVNIGPVHKKDVIKASVMLEHAREFAVILAFDVKVDKEASEIAAEMGVKIFTADIIYHLFDQFTAYMNDLVEQKRKDMAPQAIFPCILKIVPGCVFNKRDPIILGVDVVEGNLRIGTPLCVPTKEGLGIGKVTSIEMNHKSVDMAKKNQSVAIRIESASYEAPKLVGRHFTETDEIVSKITRESIDVLKESFRNDMTKDDWLLIMKLKKSLNIA